ncbi:hypothetical protein AG1IA_01364 [Rhizoctonia solani AG-1 IA]|uniref:Uncharacterized protein n=1 Tax=Thanatephorus cucumeris (strain AG1-IA) TaxID=983506 RepID=L8X692_THACA|nr:hypothetical protein AG1IA_01364 [Rhizoctonia solani AG-1 IA]
MTGDQVDYGGPRRFGDGRIELYDQIGLSQTGRTTCLALQSSPRDEWGARTFWEIRTITLKGTMSGPESGA